MIWLLVLLVLGSAAFAIGAIGSGHYREWHHAYIGQALAILALATVLPQWLGWIGVAVLLDDAGQHIAQIWRPKALSPLHLAYRHLLYNPVQRMRGR